MNAQTPNLDVSPKDQCLIDAIVARAKTRHDRIRWPEPFDTVSLELDLRATHNTTPLLLADLLAARDGDFFHDVYGIRHHIDRSTGQLKNCFLPRFSE